MPALAFPRSEATDPDPVADALDAGLLHWAKGETADSLKCLRQAREAADDAGLDRRALDLAHVAAELAPHVAATAMSFPAASDVQPSEPRRSRLPEPPARAKKYPTAGATEASSESAAAASHKEVAHGSLTPSATIANTKAPVASAASLSGRPGLPSTRPSASPSVAPANGHLGLRGAATAQSTAPSPRPSTAPIRNAEHAKTEHAKTEHAKTEHIRLPSDASWTTSTSSESATASSTPAAAEVRASSRPDALDHRLASLRVRIDRVDPDGTIRVRLLELAATASGEDNALLILPQSVWQELKRPS